MNEYKLTQEHITRTRRRVHHHQLAEELQSSQQRRVTFNQIMATIRRNKPFSNKSATQRTQYA